MTPLPMIRNYGLRQLAGRISAVRRFDSGVRCTRMPFKEATLDGIIRYYDISGRDFSAMSTILTGEQCQALERLQRNVLRSLYGYTLSYADVLEMAGMKTLGERRDETLKTFAIKTSRNQRLAAVWFPDRPTDLHGLRNRRNILQERARRTERLRISPMYVQNARNSK